jgi:hypothetical protein
MSINLEILKMAKDIVINAYVDHRAQLHNDWLAKSDELWQKSKQRLRYPDIPPYPSETDIVERAKIISEFMTMPLYKSTKLITDDYVITLNDFYIGVNLEKSINMKLPENPTDGMYLIIKIEMKNVDDKKLTITTEGKTLIDQNDFVELRYPNETISLISRNGKWNIISHAA